MRAVQREGGLLDVNVKGGLTKKKTYARETGGMDVRRRGETMAQRASIELLTLLNLVWTEAKLIELEPIRDLLRRYGDVRDRLLKAARSITVSKEALEQNLWVPSYNQGGRGTELICRLKALPKHRVIFIVGEVFAKQESLSPRGDGAFEIKLIQMLNTPIVLSNQLAEEFLNSFPTLKCFRPNGRIWIIGKIYLAEGGSIHFDSISGFRTQLKYIPIDSVNEGLVFDKADSERRHVRKPLKIDQNPENGPFTPDIQFLDCEDYERYPGEVYQGRKDDPGYVPHVQEKEAYYLGNRWAWFVEKEPVMPEFPPRRAQ
jgi:hypothetical protein